MLVPGRPLISKRRRWLVERNVPLLVNKYSEETVENLRAIRVFRSVKTIERLFIFRGGEI